jgi:hypothetical protein
MEKMVNVGKSKSIAMGISIGRTFLVKQCGTCHLAEIDNL